MCVFFVYTYTNKKFKNFPGHLIYQEQLEEVVKTHGCHFHGIHTLCTLSFEIQIKCYIFPTAESITSETLERKEKTTCQKFIDRTI